jgi:hypothetical protein
MAKKTGIRSTPVRKARSGQEERGSQPDGASAPMTEKKVDPEAAAETGTAPDTEPAPPKEPEAEPQSVAEPTIESVRIELPLGEVAESEYLSGHVESRLKTKEQKLCMKRLLRGLQQTGAVMKDGRHVQKAGDVIRYIAEQIERVK